MTKKFDVDFESNFVSMRIFPGLSKDGEKFLLTTLKVILFKFPQNCVDA